MESTNVMPVHLLKAPKLRKNMSWKNTLVHPTITAVEQPVEQMAIEACRLLMQNIAGSDKPVEDVVLRGEIVERESTINH